MRGIKRNKIVLEEGEMYGRVIIIRSDQVLVKCTDDVTRRGRIRGKLKRRIWTRDNDVVVIGILKNLKEEILFGDLHYHKLIG